MNTDSRYVFISYSTKQTAAAEQLVAFLESNDIPCWIAPRDIPPGSSYPAEIVGAIRSCSGLVLLASEDTNASDHVLTEVRLAFDNKKPILAYRLTNFVFTDEFVYYVGGKHWIKAHTDETDAKKTLRISAYGLIHPGKPVPAAAPQKQPAAK